MKGVQATIKHPFDRRSKKMPWEDAPSCTGWTMEPKEYTSFTAEVTKPGEWCSKVNFNAIELEEGAEYPCEEVKFTNDCGDEPQTWTIQVQVIDMGGNEEEEEEG